MAKIIGFKLHIGDFLSDTMELDHEELGIYLLLIIGHYKLGGPLPKDTKKIAKICKVFGKKLTQKMEKILEKYFQKSDDGFYQKRVMLELEKITEKSAKATHSINSRWEKERENESEKSIRTNIRTNENKNTIPNPLSSIPNPIGLIDRNNSSSSCLSFGEKLQQEEQDNFNKAIDLIHEKPNKDFATPVIPVGATSPRNEGLHTKGKTFFIAKIKETGQVIPEQDWIKQQLFIEANKHDNTQTLDEALTQLPNQAKTYRRWISQPMSKRMAAYALTTLFSNASEELTYAEAIIRNNGGKNARKFDNFVSACEESIRQKNYEVIV